jgi:pyruvate dehydrogenase E1 component alpha subunit
VEDSDISGCYSKLVALTEHARSGNGPSLIEISTYRKLEHCGPNDDDSLGYRPQDELTKLKERELISALEDKLLLSELDIGAIKSEIEAEIEQAFDFAESSPFPTYEQATGGVYAN